VHELIVGTGEGSHLRWGNAVFSCKFLNSHGLGSVLGSVLRGARGQKKPHEHWKVHVLFAQSYCDCALVCRIS
jgi:hypothetical protein